MAINAKSEHIAEAWEFIKYFTGFDSQKSLATNGITPSYVRVLDDSVVQLTNAHFSNENFRVELSGAIPPSVTPHYFAMMKILQEQIESFLLDENSLETTLDLIEQGIESVLGSDSR